MFIKHECVFRNHIVLARLEAFLPEIKRANETLNATDASIERDEHDDDVVDDGDMQGDARRIEMVSAVAFPVLGN